MTCCPLGHFPRSMGFTLLVKQPQTTTAPIRCQKSDVLMIGFRICRFLRKYIDFINRQSKSQIPKPYTRAFIQQQKSSYIWWICRKNSRCNRYKLSNLLIVWLPFKHFPNNMSKRCNVRLTDMFQVNNRKQMLILETKFPPTWFFFSLAQLYQQF
jgi:hypothetical protein